MASIPSTTADEFDVYRADEFDYIGLQNLEKSKKPKNENSFENEFRALNMLNITLRGGHLYYSPNGGSLLKHNTQKIVRENYKSSLDFGFNEALLENFGRYTDYCPSFISGYFRTTDWVNFKGKLLRMTICTRKSNGRSGPKSLSRGADTEGNTSNFSESELIFEVKNITEKKTKIFSYVQIRGSIPLIWEQISSFWPKAKVRLCQNLKIQCATLKQHFKKIEKEYDEVYVINLVNKRRTQKKIGDVFAHALNEYKGNLDNHLWFDFNKETEKTKYENLERLIEKVKGKIGDLGCLELEFVEDQVEVVDQQKGVFRINCMASLDRTNVVMALVFKYKIFSWLAQVRPFAQI